MKVLHILNELNPSGAETMLRSVAPVWQEQGITGHILSTGQAVGAYAASLRAVGYCIHHIPFTRSSPFFIAVARLLRAERYDVVHVHTEQAHLAYAATARLVGVPRIVRTIHSTFHFRGALRVRRLVERLLARALCRTIMVSISPSVTQVEQQCMSNPTVMIPNWYDSQRIRPPSAQERLAARIRFGFREDTFVVVSVGNCSAIKNHVAVLNSISELLRSNLKVSYLHIGREELEYPERRIATLLGVSDHVRFMGMTDDVLPALHAADAFVMPSLHEGFGVAAVEAMGAGLPVILNDSPGLRDLAGIPGVVLARVDKGELTSALQAMALLHPAERVELGRTLCESVADQFGAPKGASAYTRIYAGLEMFGDQ